MKDDVWFVTGSARGLGRNIAEAALAAGRRVAATARDITALNDLVAQHGERILTIPLDVTDAQRAEGAVATTIDHFGSLDVVVNNAGYADISPIEHTSIEAFRAQVDAVFYGTVHVTKAALPYFRRRGSGFFIQIASVGGRLTAPGLGAYQSAKFAVEGFSSVLRQEVHDLGIRVTVAEPGSMRTDWAGSSMRVAEIDPDYDATVGAMARRTRDSSGRQPIDPVLVARALIDLADEKDPPLHLLLGDDAVRFMAAALEATAKEDARWASVGRSVDFQRAAAPE